MALSELSYLGLIDGITASLVVILGAAFATFFLIMAKKRNAKMLYYLGIISLLAGLMYLGVFLDFIILVITGSNIDNSWGAAALLSYIWFAPLIVIAVYIGSELVKPALKKWVIIPTLIIGIIFTILVFLDPFSSFYFGYYEEHRPTLIDYNVNLLSIAGLFMAILMAVIVIFLGVGVFLRGMQMEGDIRVRFLSVALGALCFGIFGIMEGLTVPGVMVIIVRIGYLSSFWFMYYGLR